jgi:hypothetical protein
MERTQFFVQWSSVEERSGNERRRASRKRGPRTHEHTRERTRPLSRACRPPWPGRRRWPLQALRWLLVLSRPSLLLSAWKYAIRGRGAGYTPVAKWLHPGLPLWPGRAERRQASQPPAGRASAPPRGGQRGLPTKQQRPSTPSDQVSTGHRWWCGGRPPGAELCGRLSHLKSRWAAAHTGGARQQSALRGHFGKAAPLNQESYKHQHDGKPMNYFSSIIYQEVVVMVLPVWEIRLTKRLTSKTLPTNNPMTQPLR